LQIQPEEQHSARQGEVMRMVWNGLIRRHTSQGKDLPVILANLLGFKASEVLHNHRPVATIIGSLGHIPVGFLYNTGPRLQPISRLTASAQPTTRTQSRNSGLLDEVIFEPNAYNTVNRWVPTEIKGIILPDGPCFEADGLVLRLFKSDYAKSSAQGCDVFTTYAIRTIPQTLILRSARNPNKPLIVNALYQESDDLALRELEKFTIGFCFLLEGDYNEPKQKGTVRKGAALAIIEEAPARINTIYYCAVRAESTDSEIEARASFCDLQIVDANYSGPDVIDMLYSELINPKTAICDH
jgi:hypothetical protein